MKQKIGYMGINDISPTVLTLVVAAIIAAVGLLVISGFQSSDSLTAGSAAYNATDDAVEGISEVTGQFPTIGIIVGAVILLGIVLTGIALRRN